MKFVDRRAEWERLDGLVKVGRSGLVALWGRRRIGKTRLLLEWCRECGGLYTVADLSAEPVQRRYFAEAISSRFQGFAEVEYPDWRSPLRALSREAAKGEPPIEGGAPGKGVIHALFVPAVAKGQQEPAGCRVVTAGDVVKAIG